MRTALYLTVWAALALFVVGEHGKRQLRHTGRARSAWIAWAGGAVLCAAHMAIALGWHHRWNHDAAVEQTARQTLETFGVASGAGIYVNYLFLTMWLVEAGWWLADAQGYARRPWWLTSALRVFYFVVIANAAVVFASFPAQLLGVVLVAALLWAWRPSGAAGLHRPRTRLH